MHKLFPTSAALAGCVAAIPVPLRLELGITVPDKDGAGAVADSKSNQPKPKEKNEMKVIQNAIAALAVLLLASSHRAFAVSGIQLSIQGTDVVLRWPSQPGQAFIIGYRPTLDASTPWTFLETSYAAATGTETTYVHQNVVVFPQAAQGDGEGGGGGAPPSPAAGQSTTSQ